MPNPAEERENAISKGVFTAARRRAFIESIRSTLLGRPDDLLSFSNVHKQLHLSEPDKDATLLEIPLDKIVGSVGRYRDFNRAFFPRAHIDPGRWTNLEQLHDKRELPPIDVFQVGDVYFVIDGNHRVSVARVRKRDTILARVIAIPTRVPLDSNTSPDDLILKEGYTEFLEKTALDRTCPDQRIELTRPGGYRSLLQHIEIHQFYMGLRSRHYPTLPEAAQDWYEQVYLEVLEHIQGSGILDYFPGRTEADLYLWIAENRAGIQIRYGTTDEASTAVDSFARANRASGPVRWFRQTLHRIFPRLRQSPPKATPRHKKPSDR